MSDIIKIVGDNGKTYEFDVPNKKIFVTVPNPTATTILMVLLSALVIAIAYDTVKDFFRGVSGIHDLTHGSSRSGIAKLFGFTKGNLLRYLVIVGILYGLYVTAKNMDMRKEITSKDVPEDVQQKFVAQVAPKK
jgi:hypothetical protein